MHFLLLLFFCTCFPSSNLLWTIIKPRDDDKCRLIIAILSVATADNRSEIEPFDFLLSYFSFWKRFHQLKVQQLRLDYERGIHYTHTNTRAIRTDRYSNSAILAQSARTPLFTPSLHIISTSSSSRKRNHTFVLAHISRLRLIRCRFPSRCYIWASFPYWRHGRLFDRPAIIKIISMRRRGYHS
jgi:hypothetical protein